jgi:hypothetical protein
MLSIETRVNGQLIGYAYVLNKGQADIDNDKNCFYYVEYHKIGLKSQIMNFRVVHNREEDAEELSLLIYIEVCKRLKKRQSSKD